MEKKKYRGGVWVSMGGVGYNIVGVFEGFRMEKGDALRAGHYLISLLALKFVLLCLKLRRTGKGEFTWRKRKTFPCGGTLQPAPLFFFFFWFYYTYYFLII